MSTNASAPSKQEEPNVAGLRVRPPVAMALYALLVASAGLAMWSQQSAVAPTLLQQSAPWLFLCFAVGFSAYRLALVMAHRYSAFKAFFQVFAAALFFMLLLLPRLGRSKASRGARLRPSPCS